MQPLKRFTQCGSLTMMFAVFIVLFGVSSTALTTFGKSYPSPQQATPPPPKGKECVTHSDCFTFQSTSCVRDLTDGRMRCLCGDNISPINGICRTKTKSLRHMCSDTEICDEGMLCTFDNATKSNEFGKIVSNMKICLCDEEKGWQENFNDLVCSGGVVHVVTNILVPLMSILFSYVLSTSHLDYY